MCKTKLKNAFLIGTMLSGLALGLPVQAESIALTELNSYSLENVTPADKNKAMDKNHWAYKTLQNISKNYGLLVGQPEKKFNTNEPITRSEAALIFVNLVGQIEQKNIKMTEAEKAKVEILQQEFNSEIAELTGRVQTMEKGLDALQGRVAALEDKDSKLWGHTYGEDFKITGGVRALFNGNIKTGSPSAPADFSLPYSEVRLTGKIADHVKYTALAVPTRNFTSSANGILDDLFVSTDIIPHHEVQVGQVWVPFGMEAPMYNLDIDFIDYSQISRNLGQGLDTGTQVIGDWGFVNYTAGVYNGSGQNTLDTDQGLGYVSQVNFKPFYRHPEFGDLVIGGSHLATKTPTNYRDGFGGHLSYDIGKFGVNFEYMNVDGLNGTSTAQGDGMYADFMYRLNNKLTLLTRFDSFNPDIATKSDARYEYVLGANYLLADNVKLMLNYTYSDRALTTERDSSKIGVLTQVMF